MVTMITWYGLSLAIEHKENTRNSYISTLLKHIGRDFGGRLSKRGDLCCGFLVLSNDVLSCWVGGNSNSDLRLSSRHRVATEGLTADLGNLSLGLQYPSNPEPWDSSTDVQQADRMPVLCT